MTHYYDAEQTSRVREYSIEFRWNNHTYLFLSASGIFSKKHIDEGTQALLEFMDVKNGDHVCDLGAGIGVVGIVVKHEYPDSHITMVEINKRAVELAKVNCEKNNVVCDVVQGDLFEEVNSQFNVILCNPPYVAGRELCYRIVEESKQHLTKGGTLQIVFRTNKGGKMMQKKMEEVFGNCQIIGRRSGFSVYRSDQETLNSQKSSQQSHRAGM